MNTLSDIEIKQIEHFVMQLSDIETKSLEDTLTAYAEKTPESRAKDILIWTALSDAYVELNSLWPQSTHEQKKGYYRTLLLLTTGTPISAITSAATDTNSVTNISADLSTEQLEKIKEVFDRTVFVAMQK
jgi:hypothetical protein